MLVRCAYDALLTWSSEMLQHIPEEQHEAAGAPVKAEGGSYSLQIILWTVWTLTVMATGYVSWHADIAAQRPINLLGLVIHCGVVGVIGLVVLTVVEMRLEPWRFLE
jgi:hypothetical protein